MPEPGPNVRWVGGKFGQAASSPSGSKTGGEGRGRGEKQSWLWRGNMETPWSITTILFSKDFCQFFGMEENILHG